MNAPDRPAAAPALRHVLTHLLTPLLMCVGMGLAYLGAFAHPAPHHLEVAVVGSGARTQVMAQTLQNRAGDALDVRTVPTRAEAVRLVADRQVVGAYLPGTPAAVTRTSKPAAAPVAPGAMAPELLVATAASDTDASAVQKVFTPLAARQGLPLEVTDLVPPAAGDPTGQGLFFLLVAVSIGSYASVAVIGGAGAVLRMRLRALVAVGMALVVSLVGAALAGPLFHLVDHGLAGVWALAWLYSAGILLVGVGLHTFLKRWTTLGVMVLFVMLNFTSSGGIFRSDLQNGFFGALHSFWNGAGFLEGARGLVYFDGRGLGGQVLTLVLWLVVAVIVVLVAATAENRRQAAEARAAANATAVAAAAAAAVSGVRPRALHARRASGPAPYAGDAEEEMEEAVGV